MTTHVPNFQTAMQDPTRTGREDGASSAPPAQRVVRNPYLKKTSQQSSSATSSVGTSQTSVTPVTLVQPDVQPLTTMGGQSQNRNDQHKCHRKNYALHNRSKGRKRTQAALDGQVAFDSLKDCKTCMQQQWNLLHPEKKTQVHKKGHHPQCRKAKKNKTVDVEKWFNNRLQASKNAPIEDVSPEEQTRRMKIFFSATVSQEKMLQEKRRANGNVPKNSFKADTLPDLLSEFVERKVSDETFRKTYTGGRNAPLPILATARYFMEEILPKKAAVASADKFDVLYQTIPKESLSFTIPKCKRYESLRRPNYYSIQGQQLLHVRWDVQYPDMKLHCPCTSCQGVLLPDRSNFGKSGRLFPIFTFNGPPLWCIVMSYKCNTCSNRFEGNDGRLLSTLPPHVSDLYPVAPKYASPYVSTTFHIHRDVTVLFDEMLATYSNGSHISRCMYRVLNNDYKRRVACYFSHWNEAQKAFPETYGTSTPPSFPKKDCQFLTFYPPSGSQILEAFEQASRSTLTLSGVSDYMRHVREIQSVVTTSTIAQDHTCEVAKNYQRKVGAHAVWDVMTETGEVACAVLVDGTSVARIAHAAEALTRRPGFSPRVMYCDTWPHKENFWKLVLGDHLDGRLGLFHFLQRIIRTLRQTHIDYYVAIADLCHCVYDWYPDDYSSLLAALQAGKIGDKRHSNSEIESIRNSPHFKKKYAKYLRKSVRLGEVIKQNLTSWHQRYKSTSSDPSTSPAGGRTDPCTGKNLFMQDTKTVIEECKKNCFYLQDKVPLERQYREIKPSRASKHQLSRWVSLRGESKLENFHNPLAHFANSAMKAGIADSLNLLGTARHNVKTRYLLWLAATDPLERPAIPQHWAEKVSYWDETELRAINMIAVSVGSTEVPFPNTRPLPEDNGERFFHEYFVQQRERDKVPRHPLNDLCPCGTCGTNLEKCPMIADVCFCVQCRVKTRTAPVQALEEFQPVDPVALPAFRPSTRNDITNHHETPEEPPERDTTPPENLPVTPHVHVQQEKQAYVIVPTPVMVPQYYVQRDPFPWYAQFPTWPTPTVRPKAQVQMCCPNYYHYCTVKKRIGRPTHNKDCPQRSKKK